MCLPVSGDGWIKSAIVDDLCSLTTNETDCLTRNNQDIMNDDAVIIHDHSGVMMCSVGISPTKQISQHGKIPSQS